MIVAIDRQNLPMTATLFIVFFEDNNFFKIYHKKEEPSNQYDLPDYFWNDSQMHGNLLLYRYLEYHSENLLMSSSDDKISSEQRVFHL